MSSKYTHADAGVLQPVPQRMQHMHASDVEVAVKLCSNLHNSADQLTGTQVHACASSSATCSDLMDTQCTVSMRCFLNKYR
jgi:hypothetical protein